MFVYVLILMFSLLFSAFGSEYSTSKKLEIDGESINTLRINCGSGFLKVYGRDQQRRIEVQAEIIIENVDRDDIDKFLERGLILELEKRGSKAILRSEANQSFWESVFGNRPRVTVNLTVTVPAEINLAVDDGSGFILIDNIRGDVQVDDGSGETTIREVTGDVWVDDGSGELKITSVGGDVDVDDGSGTITIEQIGGNVTIDDGSGSININDVKKNVTIIDDGSGGVNISNVQGKIIRRDD
jgi:hypothetical protein